MYSDCAIARCANGAHLGLLIEAPPIGWLYDVSALSQTDAWAVGHDSSYNDGLILHWNGTSWNEMSSPATDLIRAIDMTSANDGWAVPPTKRRPWT